jgi:hypothetical protein
MGCHVSQKMRVWNALDDSVGRICQADIARHVMGCHVSQNTRVWNALDDPVGSVSVYQALHIVALLGSTVRVCLGVGAQVALESKT